MCTMKYVIRTCSFRPTSLIRHEKFLIRDNRWAKKVLCQTHTYTLLNNSIWNGKIKISAFHNNSKLFHLFIYFYNHYSAGDKKASSKLEYIPQIRFLHSHKKCDGRRTLCWHLILWYKQMKLINLIIREDLFQACVAILLTSNTLRTLIVLN